MDLGIDRGSIRPPDLNVGAGLTGPDTVFSPPPFTGLPFNQAVFLQGPGSFIWQAVESVTRGITPSASTWARDTPAEYMTAIKPLWR